MAYSQRQEILEIVNEPYYPFGGAFIACASCPCCTCCGAPVDKSMIPCCLGFEACCCWSMATQVNRFLIQTRFAKENTPADDCIVSAAICLQTMAACCQCFVC